MKAGIGFAFLLVWGAVALGGPTMSIDADSFAPGTILNDAFPGVTLTNMQEEDLSIFSAESAAATTGSHVFGDATDDHDWDAGGFRVDFVSHPAAWVSIDAIADGFEDYGRLEAYAADGTLLDYDVTAMLDDTGIEGPQFATLRVESNRPIAFVLAGGDNRLVADDVELDNLIYAPHVTIPVPRAMLLAGIGACFVCGLKKCRSL